MKKVIYAATIAASALMAGCATTPTTYVDTANDAVVVMGLDYKDFEKAATQATNNIIASPLMVHKNAAEGARHIMSVGPIINDTTQRIDTDQLTKKMRINLLNSGRFVVTTAVGINGAEDEMTAKIREMKNSKIVNKSTLKKQDAVVLPDFNLSGKIVQRNHSVDRSTQQVDYYFQLTMTNLENGLAYWEGEYPIIKRGSNKSVSW